jgi:hypothetical protein
MLALYEQDRLYLLREWMEWLMDEGLNVHVFRNVSNEYADAISVGDDGVVKGYDTKELLTFPFDVFHRPPSPLPSLSSHSFLGLSDHEKMTPLESHRTK